MTRDEHIKAAEELLREYRDTKPGLGYGIFHPTDYELSRAQVHATLAQALSSPLPHQEVASR